VQALDANKDGLVSREEFLEGFSKWFEKWNTGENHPRSVEYMRTPKSNFLSIQ